MLIRCDRHTQADLDHWNICEKQDAAWSRLRSFERVVLKAQAAAESFIRDGADYAGVSFGKDSTVLWDVMMRAQRAMGVVVPLVWVRVNPIYNPHCLLVRDALLAQYPDARYEEIAYDVDDTEWKKKGTGTLTRGFDKAAKMFGPRYLSGIRYDEGGIRKTRLAIHGFETKNTCAPLAWWKGADVFAYMHSRNLPVHPAYAMTRGGLLNREKIRVANIGGSRGTGFGRREWESTYYPEELDRRSRSE